MFNVSSLFIERDSYVVHLLIRLLYIICSVADEHSKSVWRSREYPCCPGPHLEPAVNMTIVFVLHRTLRTMIVIRLFEFQIRRAAAAVTVQLPGVTSPSTRHNLGEVLLISNCDI